MDKNIRLVMRENKDIVISIDGVDKIIIDKEKRMITADEIFNLLNYSKGDKYLLEKRNEMNKDDKVLDFFYELLDEIIIQLSAKKDLILEDLF